MSAIPPRPSRPSGAGCPARHASHTRGSRGSRGSRAARAAIVAVAAAGILAAALPLMAHDFWLVPDAFRIGGGETIQVRGQTSSAFPSSEAAVAEERVASARLIEAGGEVPLDDISRAGTSLLIRHRPTRPGQKIVAVTLHPRSVRESPESFRRYLALEGVPETLERLEREGRLPTDSITRRYAKYAKTLVEVGTDGPRVGTDASPVATRPVGHPLELVPMRDPSALRPGDTLPLRLLFQGRPMGGVRVHAGVVSAPTGADLDALAGTERHVERVTDDLGGFSVALPEAGLWNVRSLVVVPAAAGSGADWDTHWATLVFGIQDARDSQDSADVAAVVDRFHAALVEGDSVTVADLLSEDAIILESGRVETREHYLGGHLHGDIAFARAVPRERGPIRVTLEGDAAWATSTSTARGEYRERPVNSAGAELMVFRRVDGEWRIAAIHWSSRTLR